MKKEFDAQKVFEAALAAWCPPHFDGVVLYNPETDELVGGTWGGNTSIDPKSGLVEVYRLGANWLANEPYLPEDFFTEEEILEISEKCPDWAGDFGEGCEILGINGEEQNERLLQYLLFYNDNNPIVVEIEE